MMKITTSGNLTALMCFAISSVPLSIEGAASWQAILAGSVFAIASIVMVPYSTEG